MVVERPLGVVREELDVGGHHVTELHDDHVSGDKVDCVYRLRGAVSNGFALGRKRTGQGLGQTGAGEAAQQDRRAVLSVGS